MLATAPSAAATRGTATALPVTARLTTLLPGAIHRLQLLVGERPFQLLLQGVQRGCPRGSPGAARHHKSEWPIERRQLRFDQGARQLLGQPQPRDGDVAVAPLLHVILDLHVAISHLNALRQPPVLRSLGDTHERIQLA